LGTDKSINNINREVLQKYLESAYAPENIVISIAGNYNSQQVRGKLEKCFGMENSRKKEDIILTIPSIHSNILVKNKDIEQTHVALTLRGIELGNEKLYTLLAINNYFGGNTSSKLFQNLREDKGYVYTIYSYPSAYLNIGMFNIYFALNGQYLDSAIELIKEEIHSILINKMTDIEIKKAKEQLKGNYILGLESVSSRMFGIGKSELMLQKVHEPKEILTQIDNISREDVFEVIDFIFGNGILSAAAVGRNINEDRFKNLLGR
jgi:predicted Zn-dependent peptidase